MKKSSKRSSSWLIIGLFAIVFCISVVAGILIVKHNNREPAIFASNSNIEKVADTPDIEIKISNSKFVGDGGFLSVRECMTLKISDCEFEINENSNAEPAIVVSGGSLDLDGVSITAGSGSESNGAAVLVESAEGVKLLDVNISGITNVGIDEKANGAGIALLSASGIVDIDNITIDNCVSKNGHGAGIFCGEVTTLDVDTGSITACTSEVGSGGGLYITQGTNTLDHVSLLENKAAVNGGGIYTAAGLTLTSCAVNGNSVQGVSEDETRGNGGGIYVTGSQSELIIDGDGSSVSENIVNSDNTVTQYGGGIAVYAAATLYLINGVMVDNYMVSTLETPVENCGAGIGVASGYVYIGMTTEGEISSGYVEISGRGVNTSESVERGGAVALHSGQIKLYKAVIDSNEAGYGGAMYIRRVSSKTTFDIGAPSERYIKITGDDNGNSNANVQIVNNSAIHTGHGGAALHIFDSKVNVNCAYMYNNVSYYAGGAMYLREGSGRTTELNIYNGIFSSNKASTSVGGAVFSTNGSTVNIHGGTFTKNEATNGGAIAASGTSIVNLFNGTISGNSVPDASSDGDSVHRGGGVSSGGNSTFNMYGGVISGNSAMRGGGISMNASGQTMNLYGGEVRENFASYYGGGIAGHVGTVNIMGTDFVENVAGHNHSSSTTCSCGKGAGVYTNGSKVYIIKAVNPYPTIEEEEGKEVESLIRGNTIVVGSGGEPVGAGLYVTNHASCEFHAGTFENNVIEDAKGSGANICIARTGKFTMDGGNVLGDGQTMQAEIGGGITNLGESEISGGIVSGCVAKQGGGIVNILTPNETVGGVMTLKGSLEVSGNVADKGSQVLAMNDVNIGGGVNIVGEFAVGAIQGANYIVISWNTIIPKLNVVETLENNINLKWYQASFNPLDSTYSADVANDSTHLLPKTYLNKDVAFVTYEDGAVRNDNLFTLDGKYIQYAEKITADTGLYVKTTKIYQHFFDVTDEVGSGVAVFGSKYTAGTDVTIPDVYGTSSVIAVGANGFDNTVHKTYSLNSSGAIELGTATGDSAYSESINSLTFATSNLRTISSRGFYSSETLTSFSIPSSVTYIGSSAFASCGFEGTLEIPDTVTYVGSSAFANDAKIKNVIVGTGVATLGSNAFYGCPDIERIIVETDKLSISKTMFGGCPKLKTLSTASNIATRGFSACASLESIEFTGDTVKTVAVGAFSECTVLHDITWPSGLTDIYFEAFNGCTSIASLTLPDTLTKIHARAFKGCSGVDYLVIPESVNSVGTAYTSSGTTYSGESFDGCPIETLIVNTKKLSISADMFGGGAHLKTLYTQSNVASGGFALAESVLESITIGRNVNSFGSSAFDMPTHDGVSLYIEDLAAWCNITHSFNGSEDAYYTNPLNCCDSVYINNVLTTDLVIPDSVSYIKPNVFNGYRTMTSVTIPASVTTIGTFAFSECSNLSTLKASSMENWCNISFADATANPMNVKKDTEHVYLGGEEVTTLTIPSELTEIKPYTFYGFDGVDALNWNEAPITTIGSGSFGACSKFVTLELPSTVTTVASNFAVGSKNLQYVLMPYAAKKSYSFVGCPLGDNSTTKSTGLFYFKAASSDSVNWTIGADTAFTRSSEDWLRLPETYLGNPVSNVYGSGFKGCTKIKKLYVPFAVNGGTSAFNGCTGLETIILTEKAVSFRGSTFHNCTSLNSVGYVDEDGETFVYKEGVADFKYVQNPNSNALRFTAFETVMFSTTNKLTLAINALQDLEKMKNLIINVGGLSISDAFLNNNPELVNIDLVKEVSGYVGKGSNCIINNSKKILLAAATGDGNNSDDVYGESDGVVQIPGSYNITQIATNAIQGHKYIKDINIPATVTTFDNAQLLACDNLETLRLGKKLQLASLTVPDSVTEINGDGGGSTSNAGKLATVTFESTDTLETIGDYAFDGAALTTLDIPSTVTSIGSHAFDSCKVLTSVSVPSVLTTIGDYAFYNCIKLAGTFSIPNVVTSIGNYTFYGCTQLTSISMPSALKSIGEKAFYGCKGLTSMLIPSGVTSIGVSAFEYCENIAGQISVPSGVTVINAGTFASCKSLTGVVLGSNVTEIGINAFQNCENLASINLPSSLNTIGESAFRSCLKLSAINLPSALNTIGKFAFRSCSSVAGVVTIPATVSSIGLGAFASCSKITGFSVDSSNATYKSISNGVIRGSTLIAGCQNTVLTDLNDVITSIADYAFYGHSTLAGKLQIPGATDTSSGVTSIGEYAFYGCSGLQGELLIPSCVQRIASHAFEWCSQISSLTIFADSELLTIQESAFANCSSLSGSVEIPESVTTYGKYVFQSTKVNSLKIAANITTLQDLGVMNSLKTLTLQGTFTIASKALAKTQLETIVFVDIQTISYTPFSDDEGNTIKDTLKNVYFSNVGTISQDAFNGCTLLETVAFSEDGVESISGGAFTDCVNITNVLIQDLNHWATLIFNDKTSNPIYYSKSFCDLNGNPIKVLELSGIETINKNTFYHAKNIETLILRSGIERIYEDAFRGCSSLSRIFVPESVESIHGGAFYGLASDAEMFFECDEVTFLDGVGSNESDWVSENTMLYFERTFVSLDEPQYNLVVHVKDSDLSDNIIIYDVETEEKTYYAIYDDIKVMVGTPYEEIGFPVDLTQCCGYFMDPNCLKPFDPLAQEAQTEVHVYTKTTSEGVIAALNTNVNTSSISKYNIFSMKTEDGESAYGVRYFNCISTWPELTEIVLPEKIKLGDGDPLDLAYIEGWTGVAFESGGLNIYIEKVIFPRGLEVIGDHAFDTCQYLTYIYIPDNVKVIGSAAFNKCTSLRDVFIGNGVREIGGSAFDYCEDLKNVRIGKSVKSIGAHAFATNTSLETIFIPNSVEEMSYQVFVHSNSALKIYVGAASKPDGWHGDWDASTHILGITNGHYTPDFGWGSSSYYSTINTYFNFVTQDGYPVNLNYDYVDDEGVEMVESTEELSESIIDSLELFSVGIWKTEEHTD